MAWHAQSDGVLASRHRTGDGVCAGENQGQRPRPESLGELPRRDRNIPCPLIEMACVGQVDDQWMVRRPALGCKDLRHGGRIGRVSTESVDRLRGKCDQLAGLQQVDRLGEFHPGRYGL